MLLLIFRVYNGYSYHGDETEIFTATDSPIKFQKMFDRKEFKTILKLFQ